jgi:hypothetical protein
MPAGRPTLYTPAMSQRICDLVATHEIGLPSLCEKYPDLPEHQTINRWRREHVAFSAKYAQAKMEQAELLAESIDDIGKDISKYYYQDPVSGAYKIDSGMVAHARLLIDTRKWIACKLAPKIYGEHKKEDNSNPHEALNKIKEIVADLNKTNTSDI